MPPFCNSTNVSNEEFFKKIQHKEIMDPGPWKSPLMQEANKGLDKINRAVPTVAGPYGPAYLIGGRFWYLPRGRKFMSNIEKFTLLPTVPYEKVYDEDMNLWCWIDYKMV